MDDDTIVVVVVIETVTEGQDKDSTGTRSRSSTRAYNEGWERVFGSPNAKEPCKSDLN